MYRVKGDGSFEAEPITIYPRKPPPKREWCTHMSIYETEIANLGSWWSSMPTDGNKPKDDVLDGTTKLRYNALPVSVVVDGQRQLVGGEDYLIYDKSGGHQQPVTSDLQRAIHVHASAGRLYADEQWQSRTSDFAKKFIDRWNSKDFSLASEEDRSVLYVLAETRREALFRTQGLSNAARESQMRSGELENSLYTRYTLNYQSALQNHNQWEMVKRVLDLPEPCGALSESAAATRAYKDKSPLERLFSRKPKPST